MTISKAEHLRRAAEADEWAANTADPLVREKFEKTARHWHDLANRTASGGLRMDVLLASDNPSTQH